ncbi:MAG: RagB/SusD family nutrient uptake outer membrane protein, partial [Saprospiraceae bacterium]|nr:RagB/SusD family nutrient uptake outer membrane protein [Saprospiraceae bacterium]
SSGRKYTNKYKDVVSYTDPAPVIRYAEILLNMAEAYARSNDMPNALKNLNLVRDRSLADPATQSYISFADAKAVLGAILKERRIEFLMEGRRWSDIHRLQNDDLFPISGVPAKVANGNPKATDFNAGVPYAGALGVTALAKDDYRVIWPIPQIELNANPNLSQNPGYN